MRHSSVTLLVLAVLLLPACGGSETPTRGAGDEGQEEVEASEALGEIASLRTLAKLFYLDMGRYPETLSELTEATEGEPQGYVEKIELDPWGNEYVYRAGEELVILSMGPDGREGTQDDITGEDD